MARALVIVRRLVFITQIDSFFLARTGESFLVDHNYVPY